MCDDFKHSLPYLFIQIPLSSAQTVADLLSDLLVVLQEDADDQTASDLAVVLFETATLRSGYVLADTKAYGDRIERMLRLSMNVPLDEQASLYKQETFPLQILVCIHKALWVALHPLNLNLRGLRDLKASFRL